MKTPDPTDPTEPPQRLQAAMPATLWDQLVMPAKEGSTKHLEELFRTYEGPICAFIKRYRITANDDVIMELYQEFVRASIRKDFLSNVDKLKGRFRDFLRTCIKNFLISDAKRKKDPVEIANQPIDHGGEEEGYLQLDYNDEALWLSLDEAWAIATEKKALDKVFRHPVRAKLSAEFKSMLRNRIMAMKDDGETLKLDAAKLRVPECTYNSTYYPTLAAYQKSINQILACQVPATEIDDERRHLMAVLTRTRRNHIACPK